jgi:hypothetical protein
MPEHVAQETAAGPPLATDSHLRGDARKDVSPITKTGVPGAEVIVRVGLGGKRRSIHAAYGPPGPAALRKKGKLSGLSLRDGRRVPMLVPVTCGSVL